MRPPQHAAAERDRLLRRLRGWTTACVVGAFGLAGVFSLLAATTFPGRSAQAAPSGSGGAASTPSPAPTNAAPPPTAAPETPATPAAQDPPSPQPPATGIGSGSGRHAGAVSGGS